MVTWTDAPQDEDDRCCDKWQKVGRAHAVQVRVTWKLKSIKI